MIFFKYFLYNIKSGKLMFLKVFLVVYITLKHQKSPIKIKPFSTQISRYITIEMEQWHDQGKHIPCEMEIIAGLLENHDSPSYLCRLWRRECAQLVEPKQHAGKIFLVLKFLALSLEIQGPSPDLFHYYLSLLLA
jgi:hypothetical protein